MTVKGGTSQACAACKYQRRKCSSDCPLAPYFPPDQPKQFQNAHKLFGVSNILKLLKNLEPSDKVEAMKSIVYQANIRDRYPVTGCYGVVNDLSIQCQHAQHELEMVNAQLAVFRQHHHHQQIKLEHQLTSSPLPHLPAGAGPQLQLGSGGGGANVLSLFHQQFTSGTHHPTTSNENVNAHNNPNVLWAHPCGGGIQSQFVGSEGIACHQPVSGGAQEYDEISPFFDTIDDDANETSSESSLKDTTQSTENVEENELKSAAACFTLTSVN